MIDTPSPVIRLFETVRRQTTLTAWRDINPMLDAALRLAYQAKLIFGEDDFATLDRTFGIGYWIGDLEGSYATAIHRGHPSAVVSWEKWWGREPFMLDGERVYVGKGIVWDGASWTCTSIEKDFIRAKRTDSEAPKTVREIPRAGFEAKAAADKAKAKAQRALERELTRPDPVELRLLENHFDVEIRGKGWSDRGGRGNLYVDPAIVEWAKGYGTDYKRAWMECDNSYWMAQWGRWIGLWQNGPDTYEADVVRKRYPWPKVEAQIFRFVRDCRGLPLKDAPAKESP